MTDDPSLRGAQQKELPHGRGFDSFFGAPTQPGRPAHPPLPPQPPGLRSRPPRPSGRPRWPIVAGVVALVLVLTGIGFGVHHLASKTAALPGATQTLPSVTRPSAVPTPATSPSAAVQHTGADAKVKLGVAVDNMAKVGQFGRWLGRDPQYSLAFSPRYTWKQIANPDYLVALWSGSKYRMVYSVALLPKHEAASFANGAKGDYDSYYRELAQHLVAGGQQDAIIRLGWEFNLKTSNWSTSDPKAFIAYWRHVVTAMRSVSGQKFQFDWNPNIGDTAYDATIYYPGSKYVDYIGVDVYDISWTANTYPYSAGCNSDCRLARQEVVWQRLMYGAGGLAFWSEFAHSNGKPMSLPEWGLWQRPDGHGGNDDPYFIQQMFAFIDDPQNNVAYQCYFDFDIAKTGNHGLTTLTSAGNTFRKLFGNRA